MYELALKVHRLTDIPLLSPGQYDALFALLADEVNSRPFSRTSALRNVEDHCEDENLPVNAVQIAFVLDAIVRGGVNFTAKGRNGARLDAGALRKAFSKSAEELCKLSQLALDAHEHELLSQWLQSAEEDEEE